MDIEIVLPETTKKTVSPFHLLKRRIRIWRIILPVSDQFLLPIYCHWKNISILPFHLFTSGNMYCKYIVKCWSRHNHSQACRYMGEIVLRKKWKRVNRAWDAEAEWIRKGSMQDNDIQVSEIRTSSNLWLSLKDYSNLTFKNYRHFKDVKIISDAIDEARDNATYYRLTIVTKNSTSSFRR